MSSLIKLEILAGMEITEAVQEAITVAKETKRKVQFSFNRIIVNIDEKSDIKIVPDLYFKLLRTKKIIQLQDTYKK